MSLTNRISYGAMEIFDAASLSSSYQSIGGALLSPASILKIVNASNTDVIVSTDGVLANDVVPANSFTLYDLTTNATKDIQGAFFPTGTQFLIKGTAGVGSIYLVYLYITQPPASVAIVN